jgi:hypothetical protein
VSQHESKTRVESTQNRIQIPARFYLIPVIVAVVFLLIAARITTAEWPGSEVGVAALSAGH